MAVPITGGPPRTIVDTDEEDYLARVSPDGRWMTYIALENSGRIAFIAPFPGPGGKWQISNEPTYAVWWNPNGREIFYLTADHVVAVDVSFAGNSVRLGPPKRLFPISVNTNNHSIDVAPDGERFLVVLPARGAGVARLVTNWDAALQ